jgi:AcrR family transcriptional regulator
MVHRAALPFSGSRAAKRASQRTPALTRKKLLEAAEQVFAERGYYKATSAKFAAGREPTWRR